MLSWLKAVGILLIIILSIFSVFAIEAQLGIEENSKVTKLLNGQYSLVADGVISIYNPSNVSRIIEYRIPISLDALIGINKVKVDATSDRFDFSYGEIKGYIVEPNETISVGYHIFGLLNYNLNDVLNNQGISVIEYYSESFDMFANTILNLQKPIREQENTTINSSRLISSGIRNPTDFDYFIKELKFFRTDAGDPFFDNTDLIKIFNNLSLSPFGYTEVDFFDTLSTSNTVYWMTSDVVLKVNVSSDYSHKYEVAKKKGGGGGGSSSSNSDDEDNETDTKDSGDVDLDEKIIFEDLLLKKYVNATVVNEGNSVNVFLRVVNINDYPVYNLTITDEIPQGYEIYGVSEKVKIDGKYNLEFEIDKIDSYNTVLINYKLKNTVAMKGITYLKPAKLDFDNYTYYSEGVLLINDILPEKKIFVQKEVRYVDDDFAKITIKVKNLGSISIEDILISDNINENSIIKDISKMFYERGVWKIKKLDVGDEWEVSYLVERGEGIDSLPNVYGVDKDKVFGTMISSEEIVTIFTEGPGTVEKVGLIIAIVLLGIYLLF